MAFEHLSTCQSPPAPRSLAKRDAGVHWRQLGSRNRQHPKELVIARAQRKIKKAGGKASKKVADEAKQIGPVGRVIDAATSFQQSEVSIKTLLGQAFIVSVTFGTAFQVTHNNGLLPVYDVLPFKVGPFLESGLVPFLLAPIWTLYSYLYPVLDEVFESDDETIEAIQRASQLGNVALTWALCAAQFILSDILYLQGFPHWQIYPIMAACTLGIWLSTDRSKAGVILGILLAIGAPLGEAGCVALGLWHYDRPDNPLGVCYWTAFCYASYAYGVGNYARWQVQQQKRSRAIEQ